MSACMAGETVAIAIGHFQSRIAWIVALGGNDIHIAAALPYMLVLRSAVEYTTVVIESGASLIFPRI